MAQPSLPIERDRAGTSWFGAMPAWLDRPEHFESLGRRRAFAYLVDLLFIAIVVWAVAFVLSVLSVLSFGLLSPLWAIMGVVPLAYHTLTIGGRHSATWGMRLFDVEMRSWTGGRPDYLQAMLTTIVFYVSTASTGGLILLLGLFNRRRRLLQDLLCGVIAVRTSAVADTQGPHA
jgi:uncharacterized RDD family membrane protein YckC